MVRSWVVSRTFTAGVVDARAEGCAKAEEECCGKEKGDFGPEAAVAEFLDARRAREDEAAENEKERKEGHDGVKGLAVKLDVMIDTFGVEIEGVEALDDGGDEHEKGADDEDVDDDECVVKWT